MSKTKLEPGAEFEFVTPDELRDVLREVSAELQSTGPQRVRASQAVALDANGDGTVVVYAVPVDSHFIVHRLELESDGHDPGTPFTAAAGYADLVRGKDGERIDFVLFASSAGGLPQVKTWSSENGPYFHAREQVTVKVVGGPANGNLIARVQGVLDPLPGR